MKMTGAGLMNGTRVNLLTVCAMAAGFAATAGTTQAQGVSVLGLRAAAVRPALTEHALEMGGDFSSEAMSDQATHMIVGRSQFIDTKHRLARVYVTNPEVLDSYTASPNQVVVTAKKPGISTLILWDEAGESKSYLISSDLIATGCGRR